MPAAAPGTAELAVGGLREQDARARGAGSRSHAAMWLVPDTPCPVHALARKGLRAGYTARHDGMVRFAGTGAALVVRKHSLEGTSNRQPAEMAECSRYLGQGPVQQQKGQEGSGG